jgi:hypothetical protein
MDATIKVVIRVVTILAVVLYLLNLVMGGVLLPIR